MGLGLRAIVFGFVMLFIIFPAFMAKTTGHYYLGYKSWEDMLQITSWKGIAMWTVLLVWMVYPFVMKAHHELFVARHLRDMANKSIDDM